MDFGANYGDYNFALGKGVNTPTALAPTNERLMEAAAKTGRDVGIYVLFMVIADETDEAAMAKWEHYNDGVDVEALAWMVDRPPPTRPPTTAPPSASSPPEGAINFNMGTLVGSYETVARMLDECATVPGTKGIMLTFDDFLIGMEQFGQRIQPLMKSRAAKLKQEAYRGTLADGSRRLHPHRQQRLAHLQRLAPVHAHLRPQPASRPERGALRVRFRALHDQAARLRRQKRVLGPQPGVPPSWRESPRSPRGSSSTPPPPPSPSRRRSSRG